MSRFATRYAAWKRITLPVLAFIWCLGFASGYWLCTPQQSRYLDLFQPVASRWITLVGSLSASLLPVILSALVFRYAVPHLILPIVFAESFISGYCHSLILWCFGRTGWFVIALFGCSRAVSNVILIDYWISNIVMTEAWNLVCFKRALAICSIASILDHLLIRPLGIELISKY